MFADRPDLLRALGALGATIAAIATFVPWYVFEVALAAGGVLHLFAVPVTLWDCTTLAPILIVVGAAVALLLLASFIHAGRAESRPWSVSVSPRAPWFAASTCRTSA